jgi:hypothetical protein
MTARRVASVVEGRFCGRQTRHWWQRKDLPPALTSNRLVLLCCVSNDLLRMWLLAACSNDVSRRYLALLASVPEWAPWSLAAAAVAAAAVVAGTLLST